MGGARSCAVEVGKTGAAGVVGNVAQATANRGRQTQNRDVSARRMER